MPRPLVTVVIPTYNPKPILLEALDSVAAQTHRPVETILINDGTDRPESLAVLRQAAPRVQRYLEQPNQGLAAARNAGFRAARGRYVLPLDDDDLLAPGALAETITALRSHPEAAFTYGDYEMFGLQSGLCHLPDYNLWELLHGNTICYCALIRRQDWELAGGYNETMRCGYEDWDFWLRLAEQGRFGLHLPRTLLRYRKHGPSLYTRALERHAELVAELRVNHAGLYAPAMLAEIRRQWGVKACVLAKDPAAAEGHSIEDVDVWREGVTRRALRYSRAAAFVIPPAGRPLSRRAAEQCALGVWSGRHLVPLDDGSLGLSRKALARVWPGGRRSAELQLHLPAWWLPEQTRNHARILEYSARRIEGRRYAALLVPHLGVAGAILELAQALRDECEVFAIATDAAAAGPRRPWEQAAGAVYDLPALVPSEALGISLHSLVTAWKFDFLILAGSRLGYAVLPSLRQVSSGARVIEVVEAAGPGWNAEQAAVSFHAAPDMRVILADLASAPAPSDWQGALATPAPATPRVWLWAGGERREIHLHSDHFRRAGEPGSSPELPGVDLRFGDDLEVSGLRFREHAALATLELLWRCRQQPRRPVRCFTEFVDANGSRLAAADHEILRGSPPTTAWQPGDEAYEARQMVLPRGAAPGVRLRLSIFDEETQLRLPLQSSTLAWRDHYTAAVVDPGNDSRPARPFAMAPGPRIPCEIEFEEGSKLLGYSWRLQSGVGWLRLWWRSAGPTTHRFSFFGHAVTETSPAAPILTSFDQELRLERLRRGPVELVYDVVRDVSGWNTPARWLRAGVFDIGPPLDRRPILRSTLAVSPGEDAVYLPLPEF